MIASVLVLLTLTLLLPLANGLDNGEVVVFKTPEREHSIIVSEEGYYPNRISVFAGEKLRLFVTSTLDRPSCLTILEKNLFLPAAKGEITEGEVLFSKAGVYKFNCPAGLIEGRITVIGKKEKKPVRSIASKPKVWMPKDDMNMIGIE